MSKERKKKQKRKKKKRKRVIDQHHIVPRSRGGKLNKINVAETDKEKHALYHRIFFNMTPDEIIIYLTKEFWNGQTKWVNRALTKLNSK